MAVDREPPYKFYIPPPPKEDPEPKITNSWKMKDGTEVLLIEVLHNNPAVLHPNLTCAGHLKLHLTVGKGRGVITVPCWGCKQTDIKVSLSAISMSLKLPITNRRGTRFDRPKSETRALS